jgi:hypothetical protein
MRDGRDRDPIALGPAPCPPVYMPCPGAYGALERTSTELAGLEWWARPHRVAPRVNARVVPTATEPKRRDVEWRRPALWEGRPHHVSVGLMAAMRLAAQRPAYQVDELVAIVDT